MKIFRTMDGKLYAIPEEQLSQYEVTTGKAAATPNAEELSEDELAKIAGGISSGATSDIDTGIKIAVDL